MVKSIALSDVMVPESGLFRSSETGEQRVFAVEVTAENSGTLHHVQMSGNAAVVQDADFFNERILYQY